MLGPFRLDTEAEILFRGTEPVALGQRAVALLRVLVGRAGMPVSKDALIGAAWAGLSVEESNLAVQIAALRRVFGEEPGGERWIETLPRRGYRFVGPVRTEDQDTIAAASLVRSLPMATGAPNLTLPNQPSIAVLPFQNMSGDPEQQYFTDGMVEEIITALSRFRQLFVIARNSTFTYKGHAVDVKQVGRELGVRYVLEGSVRKSVNRVRISAQLVDALTGAHRWADHFDGAHEDIFDLQDRIAGRIVGEIEPRLNQVELERAKRKPTESLDAYDYYLRAMVNLYPTTKEDSDEALRFVYKAIELDSDFASAYGMAAGCYAWRKTNRWMSVEESGRAVRLARQAAVLGNEDAFALALAGYVLAFVGGEPEDGAALLNRALELNPNLATAWGGSGWVRVWLSEPDIAIDHLARAMRLSPLDPGTRVYQNGVAHAHFLSGRYDEALSWAAKALQHHPNWLGPWRIVAASHALAGRMEESKTACMRLRQLDPSLRISNLRDRTGPYQPDDLARYKDGLRKAGLPE
jgi:TolB-like protein/Flp pilus assembly protein TadD